MPTAIRSAAPWARPVSITTWRATRSSYGITRTSPPRISITPVTRRDAASSTRITFPARLPR